MPAAGLEQTGVLRNPVKSRVFRLEIKKVIKKVIRTIVRLKM